MSKDIIVTEGVTVSFGDFQALKGIDVRIKQGEIIVVLGPSGSGKSTFIRTLNRLQPHDGGRVEVDGVEISEDTTCLLYTSPSPRDRQKSRMPSSA